MPDHQEHNIHMENAVAFPGPAPKNSVKDFCKHMDATFPQGDIWPLKVHSFFSEDNTKSLCSRKKSLTATGLQPVTSVGIGILVSRAIAVLRSLEMVFSKLCY
jgi:hypothetical protein